MGRGDDFVDRLTPHRHVLLAYARRSAAVSADAEDALQTAIVRCYRDRERFVPGTSFRAFVFAYLVHEIANANRKRRPATFADPPEVEDEGRDVIAVLEREAAYDALLAAPDRVLSAVSDPLAHALAALPEVEREAFLLHALGELTCAEIAAVKSAPLGTILARIHRGRAKLRAALTDYAKTHELLPREGPGKERDT